jgi:pimeloyl-ACP methyl ester carboxylesterase
VENFNEFCAPNTKILVRNVALKNSVSLRVITFSPAVVTNNPQVVFIPGWISLIHGWQSALLEMSRDFTIHYVETREKISADVDLKNRFRVEDFAQDIAGIVDYFQLPERGYILLGSSLGATTIVDSYRFLPRQPLCLVLICINAIFYIPKFWQNVVRLFPPRLYLGIKPVIKWYLRNFRLDVASDAAQYTKYCRNLDAADPWKLKKAALAFIHYAIWDRLPEIEVPSLIFGASKDELHNLADIRHIAHQLPHSTFVDLETNSQTHSAAMVIELRKYIKSLN